MAKCGCDQHEVLGMYALREILPDSVVRFHTFIGCPTVKSCEHIQHEIRQSDVFDLIKDGQCVVCRKGK